MSAIHELPAAGLVPLIVAAQEAGIIEDLRAGVPVDALARNRGLDLRATQLVIDALCALGLCHREGEQVVWPARLDDGYPWTELGSFLRSGDVGAPIDVAGGRGPVYAQVVNKLSDRAWPLARAAAEALPLRAQVVDVGAGGGAWSLAMAEVHPTTRVTAIDLEPVLPRFLERARRLGLEGRVQVRAGSYFEVPPPTPFDRVVFANVLHLETPEDGERLLRRYSEALAPGGDLVIFDCIGDPSVESYARFRAFYALHLGMRTGRGGVHEEAALRSWCSRAGLGEIARMDFPEAEGLGALWARKPG